MKQQAANVVRAVDHRWSAAITGPANSPSSNYYTHTSCYSSYAAENSTTTPATASATTKRTYTSRGGKVRLNTRARWPTATAERPSTRTPAIATPASSCSRIWSSSATVHRLLVVAVAVAPELPGGCAGRAGRSGRRATRIFFPPGPRRARAPLARPWRRTALVRRRSL